MLASRVGLDAPQPTDVDWCRALGLAPDEVPRLAVLEGSWWRRERTEQRLALLDDARELDLPDLHLGRRRPDAMPVLYACAYGAARAVEPVHICGELGTPVVVQIGSCGSLQPGVVTGDIVVPEVAVIGEGASHYYGGAGTAEADPGLVDRAVAIFESKGFRVHRGRHMTTSALLAQPPELVEEWRRSGCLGVDMETSAVFTAARRFGMAAVSLLFVWDELLAGRSFLHTFSPDEHAAQVRANEALMDVALELGPGAGATR